MDNRKKINQLSHQLAEDGHYTIRQKCRALVIKVFGHEGLYPLKQLRKNGHCDIFDVEIYRLATISKHSLAKRKLYNPFKWLQFILILPFELIGWCLQRSVIKCNKRFNTQGNKPVRDFFLNCLSMFSLFVLLPIWRLIANVALTVPRYLLAPANYIVRPAIQLAKKHPWQFAACSLLAITALALSAGLLFSGVLPLALPFAAGIALAIKSTICIGATVASWCMAIKGCQFTSNAIHAYRHMVRNTEHEKPLVNDKTPPASTTRISEALHGIDPTLTIVNSPSTQRLRQTVALFTGTEGIFYRKHTSTKPDNSNTPVMSRCSLMA